MDSRKYFLICLCPLIVVALTVILIIQSCYVTECNGLKEEIQNQAKHISILEGENDSLKKAVEILKEDKYKYIKLDVTGVSHRGGGVVVNNSMCK